MIEKLHMNIYCIYKVTRVRRWPPQDVVNKLVTYGCHLVPKPSDTDPHTSGRLDWRWSFSLNEVELSKLYPENARICYMIMKIISNSYLKHRCPYLKSYHIKTVLLWTLGRMPIEFWSQSNVRICLDLLLHQIIDCVQLRHCPNFWIPSVNLFHDLDESEATILAGKLKTIKRNPDAYIPFCGAVSCIDSNVYNGCNFEWVIIFFLLMFIVMSIFLHDIVSNSYHLNSTNTTFSITNYRTGLRPQN